MSLISQRPSTWTDVVGQPRPVELLHAVLRNQRFLQRGLILHGVVGVGKTTVAYLLARALMCTGDDPLGCGACPSCLLVAEEGIDGHPDFAEVLGNMTSGVEAARAMVEAGTSLPVLGRRKVTVVDEAHFLSPEAWGAYLKTLEQGDTDSVFVFVTSESSKIQQSIRSRCIRVLFERVPADVVVGHLANVAAANGIAYELEGLRLIARQARGVVRDAVQHLDTCAALGVTVDARVVRQVVDTTLDDLCERLLRAVAARDQAAAVAAAEEMARRENPAGAAERMLGLYSRAIYQDDPALAEIYLGLPDVGRVAEVLAKWAAVQNAPADIVMVIVWELLRIQQVPSRPAAAAALSGQAEAEVVVSPWTTTQSGRSRSRTGLSLSMVRAAT